MASVFQRGGKLWVKWRDVRRPATPARNQWVNSPTGLLPGQEKLALQLAEQLEQGAAATVQEAPTAGPQPGSGPTVADRWADWSETQKRKDGWRSIRSRMTTWILPRLGGRPLAAVNRRDILGVLRAMLDAGRSPNYVTVTYQSIHLFFADAVRDEALKVSPATVDIRRELGVKRVPRFNRATAIYGSDEVERLIGDERLHPCDRVLWALEGCGGLRPDDAAHLTFGQWERTRQPLTCIHVEQTKTGVPRQVPVHPALEVVLTEWATTGWRRVYGRAPEPADLICPKVPGERTAAPERRRDSTYSHLRLVAALELLGLRRRRSHDLRRTFISLCRSNGSDLYGTALRMSTHGRESGILGDYTESLWADQCRAVLCLPLKAASTARDEAPDAIERSTGVGSHGESVVQPVVQSEKLEGFQPLEFPADVLLQRLKHVSTGQEKDALGVVPCGCEHDLDPTTNSASEGRNRLECTTLYHGVGRALELLEGGDVEGAVKVLRGLLRSARRRP